MKKRKIIVTLFLLLLCGINDVSSMDNILKYISCFKTKKKETAMTTTSIPVQSNYSKFKGMVEKRNFNTNSSYVDNTTTCEHIIVPNFDLTDADIKGIIHSTSFRHKPQRRLKKHALEDICIQMKNKPNTQRQNESIVTNQLKVVMEENGESSPEQDLNLKQENYFRDEHDQKTPRTNYIAELRSEFMLIIQYLDIQSYLNLFYTAKSIEQIFSHNSALREYKWYDLACKLDHLYLRSDEKQNPYQKPRKFHSSQPALLSVFYYVLNHFQANYLVECDPDVLTKMHLPVHPGYRYRCYMDNTRAQLALFDFFALMNLSANDYYDRWEQAGNIIRPQNWVPDYVAISCMYHETNHRFEFRINGGKWCTYHPFPLAGSYGSFPNPKVLCLCNDPVLWFSIGPIY